MNRKIDDVDFDHDEEAPAVGMWVLDFFAILIVFLIALFGFGDALPQ